MAKQIVKSTIAAAALFSLLGSLSATAGDQLEEINVRTERVSVADLNLDNAEGREALHWRLRSAAKRVCSDVVDAGSGRFTSNRDCREIALQRALYEAGLEAQTAQVDHGR
jgi:UrcA family protein